MMLQISKISHTSALKISPETYKELLLNPCIKAKRRIRYT